MRLLFSLFLLRCRPVIWDIMVIHIILRDKFTNGYIKFMETQFHSYDHIFFTKKSNAYLIENIEHCPVYEVDDWFDLIKNNKYFKLLKFADKIIISGIGISIKTIVGFILSNLIYKTYFHFWGGDFYCYRSIFKNLKITVRSIFFFYAFRKAAGLVFLIDGEYIKFQEIVHVSNRNFVAPMPSDPTKIVDYTKYRVQSTNITGDIRILVGNSATQTNHHEDVFKLLSRFKGNNIKIYCPLSYGNNYYGKKVAMAGAMIFGEKFCPVFQFMEFDEYLTFLSTMDVAIFYNDRQQALGNIITMLALGKKVFLRSGTSMWENFKNQGYSIFAVEDISSISFKKFYSFWQNERRKNISLSENNNLTEQATKMWRIVLDSSVKE